MPYRRAGSPFWWISYTDHSGARTRESSGSTDRKEAAALEASRRLETHRVTKWGDTPSRTLDEVLLQYLKDTPKKKTHDRDKASAHHLVEAWKGRLIHSLDAPDVRAYKDGRRAATDRRGKVKPAAEATIAKELLLLSAAIRHCNAEHGWNLPNPISGRVPQPRKREPRWLTREEAHALLKAARLVRRAPHLEDFISLGLATGMRRDEMLRLEWRRVDFDRGLILFGEDDQKKGVPGSIPMNDTARAVLIRRRAVIRRKDPDSEWVFLNRFGNRLGAIKTSFREAVSMAGLKRVSPHTLRHTFASWLVQADVPLRKVCELCRHEDIRTTMRYSHLAPHSAADDVKAIDRMFEAAERTPSHLKVA